MSRLLAAGATCARALAQPSSLSLASRTASNVLLPSNQELALPGSAAWRHFSQSAVASAPHSMSPKQPKPHLKPIVYDSYDGVSVTEAGKRYRLASAVVLERIPVILPELPEWERRYNEFWFRRHNELAREKGTSIMEDESAKGKKAKKAEKKEKAKGQEEELSRSRDGGQDDAAELAALYGRKKRIAMSVWEPAPRITADDIANNRKSLNRQLDKSLYLIVKKDRAENFWQFPQGGKELTDISLRATAERELKEECGSKIDTWFIGNMPAGHFVYEHSPEHQRLSNFHGTKLFFFRASYMEGDLVLDRNEIVDHLWVTREELLEYVNPEYGAFVQQITL